jgi:hypothetical protein
VPPCGVPAGGSYGDSRQGGGRQPEAAMCAMADGEEPAAGIRVSDAERDAAVERLSAATGDGRLTLEEFSQRMELATTARTRADLDGLVADLPADAARAGSAASCPPSWHVSPIGGLKIRGPWRMDRHVIVVSLVGGGPARPQSGSAGRPAGHADQGIAGGRDEGHGSPGDTRRGVRFQPDRRYQDRCWPGTRSRRADRPYPRVRTRRRNPDPPQRDTRAVTATGLSAVVYCGTGSPVLTPGSRPRCA